MKSLSSAQGLTSAHILFRLFLKHHYNSFIFNKRQKPHLFTMYIFYMTCVIFDIHLPIRIALNLTWLSLTFMDGLWFWLPLFNQMFMIGSQCKSFCSEMRITIGTSYCLPYKSYRCGLQSDKQFFQSKVHCWFPVQPFSQQNENQYRNRLFKIYKACRVMGEVPYALFQSNFHVIGFQHVPICSETRTELGDLDLVMV